MKGIFFSLNSFIAMSSGSDSPFSSTITGAFMLQHTSLLVALVPPCSRMHKKYCTACACCHNLSGKLLYGQCA